MIEGKRYAGAPDLPAVGEAVRGYAIPDTWLGVIGPANLPEPIVKRLNEAFTASFKDEGVKKTLVDDAGIVLELSSPEAFAKFLEAEIARWAKVVKDNNIKPE